MTANDEQENLSSAYGGDDVIKSTLGDVLESREKSLYWLQQQTGIAYTTLFRLRHGQASSVSFDVMNKICRALTCQPGELFTFQDEETKHQDAKPRRTSSGSGKTKHEAKARAAAITG